MVVIDPIANLINARDHARELMKLCRKFNEKGINTLLLSHLNKNSKAEDIDKIYGGVEIVNLNRLVLYLDFDENGYYYFKILKGNKVHRNYIDKKYIVQKNPDYWQIFEDFEDTVLTSDNNKKSNGRRKI